MGRRPFIGTRLAPKSSQAAPCSHFMRRNRVEEVALRSDALCRRKEKSPRHYPWNVRNRNRLSPLIRISRT
ncbi:hypothetical protein L596_028043 [Steinernema carpocapsae]|uniref:Uncharacterized protein n=1 Tax=Steinernema carpocapsae TaxID=34508 RepID=A0A4U5LXA8_STECR|nr:hypothetical protein L596_028043 [Steinernema carpocapsae]